MNVAPNSVSGRVVKTVIGPAGESNRTSTRPLAPIQLRCMVFDRVRPVEVVEVVGQPVGVGGDAHHPLTHRALEHGVVAPVAAPVGGDLLVGHHRPEAGAPVDGRLGHVGQPLGVDRVGLLVLVEGGPTAAVGGRPGAGLVLGDQLGDRPRPPAAAVGPRGVGVVPRVEDLAEDPLRPAVVGGIGGLDRAARVVAHPEASQLAAVVGHVGGRRDRRVLAGLDGELLGGQTEGVEPHRVQDVAALHALEARVHVGPGEPERVADVEPGARRVREHVEHEQLLASRTATVSGSASDPDGLGVSNVPSASQRSCQRVSIASASAAV